tara:strand:+ start:2425 stop:3333 length:909 start_codon:yes stop_codon:yes gene_type:complete
MSSGIKDMLYELGYTNIIENHKEYRTRPIYRDSDNNTVLSINKKNGRFVDFARNISGSFDDLVKITLNLKDLKDAKTWVSKRDSSSSSQPVDKPELKMPKTFSKDSLTKLVPDHQYWVDRGVTEYSASEFKGGVVREGRMANRYVFPIFDAKNNIVGFAGRDLFNNTKRPKWKLIGDKSQWKYPMFLNHEIIKKEKKVIIVESIGDMLALWDCGIKNVAVSFGLDLSSALVSLFMKFDLEKIIISFNNDSENNNAGNRAAKKAENKLLKHFDPHQISVILPTHNDFGEMSREEILDWAKSHE